MYHYLMLIAVALFVALSGAEIARTGEAQAARVISRQPAVIQAGPAYGMTAINALSASAGSLR